MLLKIQMMMKMQSNVIFDGDDDDDEFLEKMGYGSKEDIK